MAVSTVSITALKEGYIAHREEIDGAIRRVLESGWYILGKEVADFEEQFAQWCGVQHAVGVANGTDAVVVALRSLGVGEGDAVFTVSHTAVATVAAIEMTGAQPILVDIEPKHYTLAPHKLDEAIKAHRRSGASTKPRAVIGVHIYGNAFDTTAVKTICEREGLKLIEDCAQAHGATAEGKKVGSVGDVATFSFYPTKNLGAFGDGGAVVTTDSALADAARAIRQYGWHERYLSDVTGMNSRLDEIQAAILSVRLRYLDDEIAKRRAAAAKYDAGLRDIVTIPVAREQGGHAYHLYVIRTAERDRLASFLKSRGVMTGIHYPVPVHQQKAYAERTSLGPGGLKETECAAREILSLPMHPFLSDDEISYVIHSIREGLSLG